MQPAAVLGGAGWVVPGLMSKSDCDALIAALGRDGLEIKAYPACGASSGRLCLRREFADGALAALLQERLASILPAMTEGRDGRAWRLRGVADAFRFIRYDPGHHYGTHIDYSKAAGAGARTCFTVMLYLNGGFDGGELVFTHTDPPTAFAPAPGLGVVFRQDAPLPHHGAEVRAGVKYILRGDVVYAADDVGDDASSSASGEVFVDVDFL